MWNQLILVLASLIFIYGQNASVSFTMEFTTINQFSTVSLTSSTTQSYSSTKTTDSMTPSLTTFSDRETTTVSHASTTSEDEISTKTTTTSKTSITTIVGFHETSTYNNSGQTDKELGTILSAVLVPVFVLMAAATAILVLYFRKSNGESSSNKITSKVIDILDFENTLRDMNANSQLKFSEEFMALSSIGKEYSKDVAGMEVNREKNRYTDIKPYDVSRVKLSINPEDESDYINASWIPFVWGRNVQSFHTQHVTTLMDGWLGQTPRCSIIIDEKIKKGQFTHMPPSDLTTFYHALTCAITKSILSVSCSLDTLFCKTKHVKL